MPTFLLQHLVFKVLLLIVKLLLGNFLTEKEICLILYCPLKSTASPCMEKDLKMTSGLHNEWALEKN